MTRRRGYQAPGVDVSPAEMWSSIGPIRGTAGPRFEDDAADDREGPVKRRAINKTDCPCRCGCGATGVDGQPCFFCKREIHHHCTRWCKAINPIENKIHGVRGETPYIPPRRACNGGAGL